MEGEQGLVLNNNFGRIIFHINIQRNSTSFSVNHKFSSAYTAISDTIGGHFWANKLLRTGRVITVTMPTFHVPILYVRFPTLFHQSKLCDICCVLQTLIPLDQCFSTFVSPRAGKFFFIRRGPGPNKFTRKYLSNFLSSYIKLT